MLKKYLKKKIAEHCQETESTKHNKYKEIHVQTHPNQTAEN